MDRPHITIFDTTLRDGEQSPGCSMNVQEKLRLAQQLDRLGVDVIEAGFPIASDGDFEAVQRIAASVRRPIIAGLARACKGDVDRAWQALQGAAHPRIHVFLATSDIHLKYKLRITREQCLEQAREAVRHAKSLCADVEFSPEDATRTDVPFLCQVVEAVIAAGATTVNIPDTVGYTMPEEYGQLIRTLCEKVAGIEKVTISTHCHNDLGLAVANSLAGVQHGARQVECTINGIGERAGNASLEEIVMAMRVRPDRYAYETAIVSEQTYSFQPDAGGDHAGSGAAQQSHHRTQCVRARGGNSPGWHAEESADLRNHDAAIGGRARFAAGAGQALRPPRAGVALRATGTSV